MSSNSKSLPIHQQIQHSHPSSAGYPNAPDTSSSMSQESTEVRERQYVNKLNDRHLQLLKKQILAFKLISSNVEIPDQIKADLGHLHLDLQDGSEKVVTMMLQGDIQPLYTPDKIVEGNLSDDRVLVDEINHIPPGSPAAMKILYHILHNNQPTSTSSVAFPMIIPEPPNAQYLMRERESYQQNRLNARITQLEKLQTSGLPESLKIKALIELKALKLYEVQKKVRIDVMNSLKRVSTSVTALDPLLWNKTNKPNILRGARFIDKASDTLRINFATGPRGDRTRKERIQHHTFLASLVERAKAFHAFHRTSTAQKCSKLSKSILHAHSHAEKETMRRIDRLARERINALKADDEDAYRKLIDEQKDTRLTHLLRQTDIYLESLTSAVVAQKLDTLQRAAQDGSSGVLDLQSELGEMDSGGYDGASNKTKDYYSTAHRISESVVQPPMLVGGKLKDYQLRGLQWMVSLYNNRLNGILADEMGLGKTIQTIALISYLIEFKFQTGPYLVVVPLSTMTNWSLEFEKWAPSIIKIEYKGVPPVRKSLQSELKHARFNVLLTTYEYIIKDKSFLSKIKWLYLIVDEGHRMKNSQSKLVSTLASYYSTRYRIILTGTPLQNSLPELWALLNFVLPKIFASSQGFDEWFNAPFANTGERLELNEEESLLIIRRLHKVLRPFLLRRLKKDVEAELPDKIERILKVPLTSLQKRLYSLIREKTMLPTSSSNDKNQGLRRFNNTVMQLRKICNHPFVFAEVERQIGSTNPDMLWRVAGKFDILKRILPKFKASGHRILMFFQMTTVMTIMEDWLNAECITYLRLDGSTKAEERSELLRLFNAPHSTYSIFLLSTRAGGLGLNLQSADTVVLFDSDWNPHQDLQAQDRAHRIGQTKEVRIFRLVTARSIEELILARAQYKLSLDGKIIQAGRFDHKSTNEERDSILRALLDMDSIREKKAKKVESYSVTRKKTKSGTRGRPRGRPPAAKKIKIDDMSAEPEQLGSDQEATVLPSSASSDASDEDDSENISSNIAAVESESEQADSESDEDEVCGDDELNELLARNAEELELFKKMDIKQNEALRNKYGRSFTRLINESELPPVYLNDPNLQDATVEEEEDLGRGARSRGKYVQYDDHLSEDKWLKGIEKAEDEALNIKLSKKMERKSKLPVISTTLYTSESEENVLSSASMVTNGSDSVEQPISNSKKKILLKLSMTPSSGSSKSTSKHLSTSTQEIIDEESNSEVAHSQSFSDSEDDDDEEDLLY